MKKTLLFSVAILILCTLLNGCSVAMALKGKENIDRSDLYLGQERSEVINFLGKPHETKVRTDGNFSDKYTFDYNNQPSIGRAAVYIIADICTLCFWEFIGTPMEATSSEQQVIIIEYDENNKVKDLYF